MNDPSTTKSIATVRDVCRMVGLSPARFYGLMKEGIFPYPVYDLQTRRPFYTEEQQLQCLEVRRRNCGINGKPVLFYARRLDAPVALPRAPRRPAAPRPQTQHSGLLEALRGLGLATATAAQVAAAVKVIFPKGVAGTPEPEVIRAVFLHLKRQNRGGSEGG